jgi:winged helix DNA-binding protein
MIATRLVTNEERRRRLGQRHGLAPGAAARTPEGMSRRLVGFHGTDPTSAYLACWARVDGFQVPVLERALYEERSLLKILWMRRTMFVVPADLAAIIQGACTDAIARRERARLVRMIEEAGIAKPAAPWIAEVERQTVAALDRLGEATAADLTKEVDGLRAQIPFGAGKRWQGTIGVSTRMLFLLSTEGRIIRGRPKGTLVSSLYRWAPMDRWLPEPLPILHHEEAEAELMRHYLGAYGPATTVDLRWWAGWTLTQVRRAIAQIGAIEVDLDGGRGWVLPDDVEGAGSSPDGDGRWVALLPALDATIMGWQQRDWFLAPHAPRLFDTNGNAGPTIWVDGRAVGGWAQRRSGEIRWELLEDLGAERRAMIEAKVAALAEWLGPLRFLPRFRTPLEQELSA